MTYLLIVHVLEAESMCTIVPIFCCKAKQDLGPVIILESDGTVSAEAKSNGVIAKDGL